MLRQYFPLVDLPARHHKIAEQLKRDYLVMVEEYGGRVIDHVLNGVNQLIVRVPTDGYCDNELIVELYRLHLRYVRKINLAACLLAAYHRVPLLHWFIDQELFLQIAAEMETHKLCDIIDDDMMYMNSDCHLSDHVFIRETDFAAMEKSFSHKPSQAIIHRFIYSFIKLYFIDTPDKKHMLFRLYLVNSHLSYVLEQFAKNWRNFSVETDTRGCVESFTTQFVKGIGNWNMTFMLSN